MGNIEKELLAVSSDMKYVYNTKRDSVYDVVKSNRVTIGIYILVEVMPNKNMYLESLEEDLVNILTSVVAMEVFNVKVANLTLFYTTNKKLKSLVISKVKKYVRDAVDIIANEDSEVKNNCIAQIRDMEQDLILDCVESVLKIFNRKIKSKS